MALPDNKQMNCISLNVSHDQGMIFDKGQVGAKAEGGKQLRFYGVKLHVLLRLDWGNLLEVARTF